LEKEHLVARVKQLEETLQTNARKWGGVIKAKAASAKGEVIPVMSFSRASVNQFFNVQSTPSGDEQNKEEQIPRGQ
jgi:hypothetical protein